MRELIHDIVHATAEMIRVLEDYKDSLCKTLDNYDKDYNENINTDEDKGGESGS